MKVITSFEETVNKNAAMVVGNGSRIGFSSDVRCGTVPLSHQFPALFEISSLPEGYIVDHTSGINGVTLWNLHYLRDLFDWKIDQSALLLHSLEQVAVTVEDKSRT